MLTLTGILIAAACVVALFNWRWGVAAAILVGLLQDPLRKLIPGAPGFLAMASAPVWLAIMVSALLSRQLMLRRFLDCFPRMGRWILWVLAYMAIPAVLSASYGQNSWMITILGGFVYATMFMALVAGFRYPGPHRPVGGILAFYAVITAVMLIGGPLEAWGWSDRFAAIGTEALGHVWVTHRTGAAVHMLAGFFRGPDVMGWHATLMLMICSVMAFRSRGPARVAWIALAVWGALNIWLCGRRKMLSMLPVFLGCYLFLLFRFKDARRFVSILGTVLMIGGLGWYLVSSMFRDAAVEAFYLTAFTQAEEQIQHHGIDAIVSTVKQAGFWGYGLGMSQQGIHHIDADKPEIWQESGPGKLVAEFGVPGSVLILILGLVFFATAFRVVQLSARDDSFFFTAGIFSMLAANLTSAVVSAQIFGDPFVSLFLAFMAGLLLSAVRTATISAGGAK